MHNDSSHVHCEQCEMKKIGDEMWVPGLFVKLVSLAVLAVLTTGANGFLIYVAYQTKSLVSNTKVFVISLCFAHLVGSLIIIPLWILSRVMPELASDSPVFCQTSAFMWILMTVASFYSLSAISVDRFCIISNPMRYPVKATTPKKLLSVGVIWGFSGIFATAPEFGWGVYKFKPDAIPVCELDIKESLSFALTLLVIGFLAPLLVDIVCCARIISIAMRQSRAIDSRKGSGSTVSIASTMSVASSSHTKSSFRLSKLKQKLNSLRLVFAGTGNFLICWLPYIAAHAWMTGLSNMTGDTQSVPYILEFTVMFLALLNGFLNPIVVMFSNRDYTRRIKLLMFRRFGLFKNEIHEERSENDSSVTNLRRSQQYRSVNLIEIFQNLNQLTENNPTLIKTGFVSDEKSSDCLRVSESCLCFEDVKSQQKCLKTLAGSKSMNELPKSVGNISAAERRRLMLSRSRSGTETESIAAFVPGDVNLSDISENKSDKPAQMQIGKDETALTIPNFCVQNTKTNCLETEKRRRMSEQSDSTVEIIDSNTPVYPASRDAAPKVKIISVSEIDYTTQSVDEDPGHVIK